MRNFIFVATIVFNISAQASSEAYCGLVSTASDTNRPSGSHAQIVKDLIKENQGKDLTQLDWSHRGSFTSPTGHQYDSPLGEDGVVPAKMRSAVLLNGSTLYPATSDSAELPDKLYIGNIRHNDDIYVAEIPWKKIVKIEIQKQQMSVVSSETPGAAEINSLVAHARIKFIFAEGFSAKLVSRIETQSGIITLVPLTGSEISLPSLSLSAEALTNRYDFAKGADEKYAFGHFFQAESVPLAIANGGGGALTPLEMASLSEDDKKKIFLESLITSQLRDRTCDEVPKYKNTYNLVSNNCIASTFEVLERAGFERGVCPRDDVDEFLAAIPPLNPNTPPTPEVVELFALLEQAGVSRATAMRVAGSLSQAKESGNVWVATRIPCWLESP